MALEFFEVLENRNFYTSLLRMCINENKAVVVEKRTSNTTKHLQAACTYHIKSVAPTKDMLGSRPKDTTPAEFMELYEEANNHLQAILPENFTPNPLHNEKSNS